MADYDEDDTEEQRKKAQATTDEAEAVDDNLPAESPDDVIVPADPQIMTMTGAPPVAQPSPAAADPRARAFGTGMHGMPNHFGGPGGNFLQQIFQRIQQARQARMQQFAQSPMGQQFMASPMGQRMEQRHPDWPMFAQPADPANAGTQPANAAAPPTAAQQANAQAAAAQQAPAAKPEMEETTTTTKTKKPYREQQQQAQRSPAGVQQPQQRGALPTFGGNANASIQDALRARMGGGGMRRGMF